MKELSDELFVKEMRTLWKNNISIREFLGLAIKDYFEGKRAKKIILKLKR